MIIKLKNVRQHEDLTLELPDQGVVRLYGKSGIGKTTIFDAIEEALYGSASDMAPWGSSKSSVELTLGSLEIIRTRGPQTLTVRSGDITIKDDEAQEFINKALGMTEQEFLACSYIKQGSANSLLSLGPADQLRFIEALSIGDANPEKTKEKIKNLIRESEKEMFASKAKLTELLKRILENKNKIRDLSESLGERPTLPFNGEFIREKERLHRIAKEAIADLEVKISNLDQLIVDPKYALLRDGEATVSRNESRIASAEDSIAKMESDLSSIQPWSGQSKSEVQSTIETIKAQRQFLEIRMKMREVSKEISITYPDVKEYGSVSGLLDAKKTANSTKIQAAVAERFKAIEKEREISSLHIPQYCPSCSAPLAVVASRIVSTSDVPKNLDEIKGELSETIWALNQEVAACTKEEGILNNWLAKCANLKASLPSVEPYPSIKTIEDCDSETRILNQYLVDNSTMEARIRDLGSSILNQNKIITQLLTENLSIAYGLEEAKKLPPQERVRSEKDSVVNMLHETKLRIASLEADLNRFAAAQKAAEAYESIEKVLSGLKSDLLLAEEEFVACERVDKELELKVAAAVRLKELSDFAAVSAIDSTLEDVNSCSAFFLEKMFPEDGTVIKLKNSTTTKTGEERAKLSVEVFHKGKYAKRLSNLSGGEKSRACLAFQLGLSELYKSPILMIDEGFSGLGDNDKEQCLEILHDVVKDKLVLVIEHGAGSANFDTTISIGE